MGIFHYKQLVPGLHNEDGLRNDISPHLLHHIKSEDICIYNHNYLPEGNIYLQKNPRLPNTYQHKKLGFPLRTLNDPHKYI